MNDPNSVGTTKRAYNLQNIEKAFLASGKVQGSPPSLVTNTRNAVKSVADLYALVKKFDKEDFLPISVSERMLNSDGTPQIVYHQTSADFWEFSNDKPVAGNNDSETPNGYFFKDNNHDIGLGGSKQMAVYLSIKNPIWWDLL